MFITMIEHLRLFRDGASLSDSLSCTLAEFVPIATVSPPRPMVFDRNWPWCIGPRDMQHFRQCVHWSGIARRCPTWHKSNYWSTCVCLLVYACFPQIFFVLHFFGTFFWREFHARTKLQARVVYWAKWTRSEAVSEDELWDPKALMSVLNRLPMNPVGTLSGSGWVLIAGCNCWDGALGVGVVVDLFFPLFDALFSMASLSSFGIFWYCLSADNRSKWSIMYMKHCSRRKKALLYAQTFNKGKIVTSSK